MIVRCPRCRSEFRLVEFGPAERVVKYFCPGCEAIVRVDLELDEVQSSSASGRYRGIERRKTVLVADHALNVLAEAEELLSEAGLRVLVATDGEEAMRLIRDEHPDLVVTDVLMPGKSGFELLREIRHDARIKDIPVIAMSRVYKDSILGFLHETGAAGFLDKDHMRSSLVFRVLSLLTPPPAVA